MPQITQPKPPYPENLVTQKAHMPDEDELLGE